MKQTNANVCIIDYGSGNTGSVYNIFKSFHDSVKVSNDAEDLKNATHLVLPGVGAFKAAMEKILKIQTFDLLKDSVLNEKKPFLGICVGMQVLASEGHEHCTCKGLGWIYGVVRKLESGWLSLPHVGWNNIKIKREDALVKDIGSGVDFYYVHSYRFEPKDKNDIIASTDYGEEFAAIVKKDNIYGMQFHPEKSQKAGIKLLKNFLDLQ